MSFVIVETKDSTAKAFEKAEDVEYVKANGIKIDRVHYIDHHLIRPVSQLFEPFIDDPKAMFKSTIEELNRQRTGQRQLEFSTNGVGIKRRFF